MSTSRTTLSAFDKLREMQKYMQLMNTNGLNFSHTVLQHIDLLYTAMKAETEHPIQEAQQKA